MKIICLKIDLLFIILLYSPSTNYPNRLFLSSCRVSAQECNPYLMEDTGDLWEKYVKRDFRNKVLPLIVSSHKTRNKNHCRSGRLTPDYFSLVRTWSLLGRCTNAATCRGKTNSTSSKCDNFLSL